jgi:hypothetical protein
MACRAGDSASCFAWLIVFFFKEEFHFFKIIAHKDG